VKQIIQNLKSGETILEEVPVPQVRAGQVLIKTHRSLVSLGTEKMLVNFGKANFIDKARQQPDKVKMVLNKIKTDGLRPTMDAVFRKLGEPLPLGYCNVGEVVAVGKGVDEFQIGDRVASNGNHAEVVSVPKNLVAKIPDDVPYDEAAFTVIGAIALQGIRLINPTFGETIVVTGLGLIGLVATQLLKANGCKVIGLDFDEAKVALAKQWGIEAYNVASADPIELVMSATGTIGADGVLITASTSSNDVISQAANMSRKKGRIVLVGVIGLNIQRSDFFKKELSFQVSSSYGPGRYDDEYELKGNDYPIGYVRWTEKRNFEAILSALSNGQLDVKPLISEIVELDDYNTIYGNMGNSKSIASILKYSEDISINDTTIQLDPSKRFEGEKGVVGIIGAGNYTKAMILPNLSKLNAPIKYIASANGLSSTISAKKFGIAATTTNYQDILQDKDVDAVVITTRHNLHANQVVESLEAGKHVFVEKPLALNYEDLGRIEEAYANSDKTLTIGFNRRFSPFIQDARKQLGSGNTPINVIATMNAGFIPPEVWVQDMEIGGGRILGEACHLIDLITFLTGSMVDSIVMNALGPNPKENTDNASILLKYKNGSQGVINYFSNGSKAYSKERVEIYSQNRTMVIDNFRKSFYYGFKSKGMKKRQDKGQTNLFRTYINSLKNGGKEIIPYGEIMNTSKAVIAAIDSLKEGTWVKV